MATIITTTINTSNTINWLTANNTDIGVFTSDEYTQVVEPYRTFIQSLPGLQSSNFDTSNNMQRIMTLNFDTADNANSAFKNLYGSTANTICINYKQLIDSRKKDLNLIITGKTTITY